MPLILGANSVSGYTVKNSLRFNSGSSDELTRTFPTNGNRQIFTFSFWTKLTTLGTARSVFFGDTAGTTNATQDSFFFNSPDTFVFGGWTSVFFTSTMLFRDVSAWYHIVVAVDTTQATSANRIKFYVNGTEQSYTSGAGYPAQNANLGITKSGNHSFFGNDGQSGRGNGYLAETYLIDGQQLTPTSFGETDTETGIWIPKAYTGTYGTNGFKLEFKDSASLGTDTSGNGNTFTVTNLTSIDQTTDTPTNNFNTLNPLVKLGSNFSAPTEGNLSLSSSGTGDSGFIASTIIPSAGKWYFEAKVTVVGSSDRTNISIANFESITGSNNIANGDYKGITVSTGTYGRVAVTNGATTTEFDNTGYVPVANDIMIFAVDMDNSRVYIGKNGTWFTTSASSGGNPATSTGYFSPVLGNGFSVGAGHSAGTSTSATHQFNFGNPIYSANSYADGAGYGNFSYAVPSGYYALCTKNLANFG